MGYTPKKKSKERGELRRFVLEDILSGQASRGGLTLLECEVAPRQSRQFLSGTSREGGLKGEEEGSEAKYAIIGSPKAHESPQTGPQIGTIAIGLRLGNTDTKEGGKDYERIK